MKRIAAALMLALCCLLTACGETPEAAKRLSVNYSDGTAVISWEPNDEAQTCRLYRRAPNDDDYRFIFDCQSGERTYTDRYIELGGTYSYKLETLGKGGASHTLECSVTVPAKTPGGQMAVPEIPVISSVTAMDRYTAVVSAVPQTDCQYEFWRSAAEHGEYELAATCDEPYFYDEHTDGNVNWYYRVRAVRGNARSELSEARKTGYHPGSVFGVPVLMYHEFVTPEDLASGIAFDKYAVYADEFESDLNWLRGRGYTTITTAQLIDCLSGKGSLPEKPMIITIDDGKFGVYKRAWPLLKKYGMKASLSIIGYEIDNATAAPDGRENSEAPYCTWQELAEMSDSGVIEIISHTNKLHYYLHDGRYGASTKEGDTLASFLPIAQKDYADTALNFRRFFNTVPTSMAYPYSKRTELADEAWLKSGYRLLYTGDDDLLRRSMTNYFVREAGLNRKSAVLRRVARMTNHPIEDYIED